MTDPKSESTTFSPAAKRLRETCLEQLGPSAVDVSSDPLANGVRRLAFQLDESLKRDEIDFSMLRQLMNDINKNACLARVDRFHDAHFSCPVREINADKLMAAYEDAPFDVVKNALERAHAGVVFTAHPTFANPAKVRAAMATYGSSDRTAEDKGIFLDVLEECSTAPDFDITLFDEHAEAVSALSLAQDAIDDLTSELIGWMRGRYPEAWKEVVPTPISLATWVGYDLDGRTDIHWAQTFRLRLEEKAQQLKRYAERLQAITADGFSDDLQGRHDRLIAALQDGALVSEKEGEAFAKDLEDPANVIAAANMLTDDHPGKITSLKGPISELDALIAGAPDDAIAALLLGVKAAMINYGLGLGRIHLRVNAAQVRSALRRDLGLTREREFSDRSTLASAANAAMAANDQPRRINFASVFNERMTARRQLMLCAQFVKHVDADTPIRFLIAECEAPATIMGAVYLTKLYGVDRHVDVSPLFETPEAMEGGGRFLERLLDEPAFIDYIKNRGRIAIQLGFSDSGRFMGQIAADLAIERLHVLLAREMEAREVTGVEALVFNTHGESMGRGGFPGSLNERFDHLLTPWSRARFAKAGIPVNAESSFQGGDGFLHFGNATLAAATVRAMASWAFDEPAADKDDLFYQDINYSWDVYRGIKRWQEEMFRMPAYQAGLSSFGPNLLLKTGSRKTRRQSGTSVGDIARSLRAIPHNAILQQLAAPANVVGGLGAVAGQDPERFEALLKASPRMQGAVKMAKTARDLTSLAILRGYSGMFDPSFWTIRARHAASPVAAKAYDLLAERTTAAGLDISLGRLANHFSADRRRFDSFVAPSAGAAERGHEPLPKDLYILHAMRMAVVMRGWSLVAGLPAFSARHEVQLADLIDQALALDFDTVADLVEAIFPVSHEGALSPDDLTEEADAPGEVDAGYPEIETSVITPLRECADLIRETSAGIAHFYGAYG